eukprot:498279-Alexandrium_andersonii.AAC.1
MLQARQRPPTPRASAKTKRLPPTPSEQQAGASMQGAQAGSKGIRRHAKTAHARSDAQGWAEEKPGAQGAHTGMRQQAEQKNKDRPSRCRPPSK